MLFQAFRKKNTTIDTRVSDNILSDDTLLDNKSSEDIHGVVSGKNVAITKNSYVPLEDNIGCYSMFYGLGGCGFIRLSPIAYSRKLIEEYRK